MKTKIFFTAILAAVMITAYGQKKTYFVSPEGNDAASGLSIKEAWKTLDKVNSLTFQPGDQILFKAGAVWHGQLKPQGSGSEGMPIRLSGYGGEGENIRPVINIGEAAGAGIRLTNQSWWEIENMEVTSGAQPKLEIGRQGIVAIIQGAGRHHEHIVIRNCYIHDVWGQLGGTAEYTGYSSAGILVRAQGRRGEPASLSLKDVLVENNRIERMDKCAIVVNGVKTGMVIRKNYMENLGGDGIFAGGCDRGIIEYNIARRTCMRSGYQDLVGGMSWWPHTAAIWIQNAEGTIMQFNEVYDTGRQPGNGDGFAYDFDFYCVRCTAQYNYSKNNAGFMLLMNRTFENVTRYNISQNDQTHLVQMHCDNTDRNVFYNNIFYIDYGTVDLDFFLGDDGSRNPATTGAAFHNNIFYATGQSHFRTAYSQGHVLTRTFDEATKPATGAPGLLFYNNCYFGPWKNGLPDDPAQISADPMFVQPGAGSDGLCSLGGYRLRPGSPLINKGIYTPLHGGRDFWNNPLDDGRPDVGAYEQIGSGLMPDPDRDAAADGQYRKESAMAWAKWSFPLTIQAADAGNEIVVRPLSPLDNNITGSIAWTDAQGKTVSMALDKLKQRDVFTLKVKADKAALVSTALKVCLQYYELREEWSIPVVERVGRNN